MQAITQYTPCVKVNSISIVTWLLQESRNLRDHAEMEAWVHKGQNFCPQYKRRRKAAGKRN
jgi:hypothetical protein